MRFALTSPVLAFVLLGTLLGTRADAQGADAAPIAWQTDVMQARTQAINEGKPLLLHFYTDNCVWCDRLEAGAFQTPEVSAAIASGFVPVKVHAGQSPEIAGMFQVTKFPTDVVVLPSGQTLSHSVSPQVAAKYVAMLTEARSRAVAMPSITAATPNPTAYAGAPPAPAASSQPTANPAAATRPAAASNPYVTNPPGQFPGGATGQLAGVKTDGMSLGMPAQMAMPSSTPDATQANPVSPSSMSPEATPSGAAPKLAMEGFCSVTVIDEGRWSEGNPKFGVVHLGKLYLFESQAKMETFLNDPEPYTPVLNEIDVIRFFEERRIVMGKRQFGVQDPIHGRMFFFADEAALNHFDREYQRYVDAAIEVMDRAVKEANPNSP